MVIYGYVFTCEWPTRQSDGKGIYFHSWRIRQLIEWFTKLDLRYGYHQLLPAEESCYITTFATQDGIYRYKKLNLFSNFASEIFQNVISEQIRSIPNAVNTSNDLSLGKPQVSTTEPCELFSNGSLLSDRLSTERNVSSVHSSSRILALSSWVLEVHQTQQNWKQSMTVHL